MQRVLLFVTLGAVPCYGMNNGVALTPPMGWNPWNCFGVGRTGTCKLPLPWEPGKTITSGSCTFDVTFFLEGEGERALVTRVRGKLRKRIITRDV